MASVDTPRTPPSSYAPPTIASGGSGLASARALPVVRIGEDGFVPEATVDAWVRSGAAVREGTRLTVPDGRRYQLCDAVRVIGRRNGDTDPYGFTGRVDSIRELIRRGANVSADALRLGPAVYDIEYGVLVSVDSCLG